MSAYIVQGDARRIPLADESVDLIVTSPPYFSLRSYRDGGKHYDGQVGSEETPQAFLEALWAITAECQRVLKASGSMFVNLGDSYSRGQRFDSEFSWEDAAWLGGVVDSDGSIGIHINKQAEGRSPSYVAWVRVGQMKPEVVHHIQTVTGVGRVTQDGRGVWTWAVAAQQARRVLERIWPWLHIKRRQACAAVECARHVGERRAKGTWNKLTLDDVAYRQRLRDAVLAWNQGEADDLEPPGLPLPDLPRAPRWINAKSLMGIPWRYAIGCIDGRAGAPLILRAEFVWCLSGGAHVYARTPTGDRPIMLRDLVRAYQPENVQLWNGEKWTQVLGWNRTADDDGAVELELRSGERIGCTPGHQWPTHRGLLRADEVRVGDVIGATTIPEPDSPNRPGGLDDEDVGWLVGLYIAEGSRSSTVLQFAGHVKEKLRHERLARIAAAYDGTCRVYQTGDNSATCNLSGSVLVGIIDRYVSPGMAATKRLTIHAWQRSNGFLAAVMEGYLAGDGHYEAKSDRWRLGFTQNEGWAVDLRTLAARLGASLTLKRSTTSAFNRVFQTFRGEWRWRVPVGPTSRNRGEVVAIRASRARQFFDVGVADEPHTFALASGVLTHNSKPNGLPENVTDRVRRSHEQFFHFTKEGRYFSAVDEIREPTVPQAGLAGSFARPRPSHDLVPGQSVTQHRPDRESNGYNPLGKLPGSVWRIPSEPLVIPDWAREKYGLPDHFAAFPQEWPRRLILGWSPKAICVECGEGRRPIATVTLEETGHTNRRKGSGKRDRNEWDGNDRGFNQTGYPVGRQTASITGYACACPEPTAPTRPSVILDPFGGTGTVAMVARTLGRIGVSLDLSHDYCKLARWRCFDSGHGAKSVQRTYREAQGRLAWIEDDARPVADVTTGGLL